MQVLAYVLGNVLVGMLVRIAVLVTVLVITIEYVDARTPAHECPVRFEGTERCLTDLGWVADGLLEGEWPGLESIVLVPDPPGS